MNCRDVGYRREREVLEDLENAINRCDQTAEMILDIAVKQA